MKDKMTGLLEKLKGFFKGMDKKQRNTLIGGAGAVVAIAVIIAVLLNNKPYETLFTGLTSDEASSIMSMLQEFGETEYRLENNDTIVVPREKEAQLKAKLLMQGYPKSGFNYSTYLENVSSMSSESDRQAALLFELQDRMAAVIRCFAGVKDAVVTIAQGEDRRYVLDSSNMVEASASVMVTMQNGQALSEEQATAIRLLVSRSVQGLTIDNITITDSLGNVFSGDAETGGSSTASALKLSLERQVNNQVRANVMQVLNPIYGANNIRVSVNSTVDVGRRVQETINYSVPEGAPEGEGIIGSKVYDQELSRDGAQNAGGVVGAQANSDINTYMDNQGAVNGNEDYIRNSGEIEYDVNQFKEQAELSAGVVTDVSISVTINSDAGGAAAGNALVTHIARAAGISTQMQNEKISVLMVPFAEDTTEPIVGNGINLPAWALYAAIGGVILLLILLLLLGLLGRKKKKKKKKAGAMAATAGGPYADEAGLADNAEEPVPAPILDINNQKNMELKKDLRQFTETNPEIAAQMIKVWLKGGGENG